MEIAASLGVKGVALTEGAMGPKRKHAVVGAQRARELLLGLPLTAPLTPDEVVRIIGAVRYHDEPWMLTGGSTAADASDEMKLVCDADHLWSFTRENFWQDTARKGVDPQEYVDELAKDLDGYFVTDEGRQMARIMLEARQLEVDILADWLAAN